MALFTSYYANPKVKGKNRVAVSRFLQDWILDEPFLISMKELAPSAALFKKNKAGELTKEEFFEAYLAEIKASKKALASISTLESKSDEYDVYLLCYEKEDTSCHRRALRSLFTKEIKEVV